MMMIIKAILIIFNNFRLLDLSEVIITPPKRGVFCSFFKIVDFLIHIYIKSNVFISQELSADICIIKL